MSTPQDELSADRDRRFRRVSILFFPAIIVVMVLAGAITFFLSVRGEEETLVPEVRGQYITKALIALQEKELYPRIEERVSSDVDKGVVINQDPVAGSVVKAGRRILLAVSRGPMIERVGDYVGQSMEGVRLLLAAAFASSRQLLKIQEPVMYIFDSDSEPGIILEQKPEPETPIVGSTLLQLVVSRGPRGELIEVGDYNEMPFEEAIEELAAANMPFVFSVKKAEEEELLGVIVSQSPDPESEIPFGSPIQFEMTHPGPIETGMVFGIFSHQLPDYTILVDIRLDAVSPTETKTILSMKYEGGPVSVPYLVETDAELIFYISDKVELRQKPKQLNVE